MVSAVWDPRRNWKVRAEGGKDAKRIVTMLAEQRAGGHTSRKTRSTRKLKEKMKTLPAHKNDEGTRREERAASMIAERARVLVLNVEH